MPKQENILIIGAGLCGSLLATIAGSSAGLRSRGLQRLSDSTWQLALGEVSGSVWAYEFVCMCLASVLPQTRTSMFCGLVCGPALVLTEKIHMKPVPRRQVTQALATQVDA